MFFFETTESGHWFDSMNYILQIRNNERKSLGWHSGGPWSSLWQDLPCLVSSTDDEPQGGVSLWRMCVFSSTFPVDAKKAGVWEPTMYTSPRFWIQWHTLQHEMAMVGVVIAPTSINAMNQSPPPYSQFYHLWGHPWKEI